MDGVHVMLFGHRDDSGNIEIRLDGPFSGAYLVGFIGFEAVQGQAIFLRVNGHGAQAKLVGGTEDTDGNFAAIGSQYFANRSVLFHRKASVRFIRPVRNSTLFHEGTDRRDCFFQCRGTEYLILVPFQPVPENPFENTLPAFASVAWTVIWPR